MTIEQKAKAYDEALKRVTELSDAGNALTKLQLGIIFPELAENEDERIRKELLRCFDDLEKGKLSYIKKEDVPAIRAYLEKQKEQKPVGWSEEDEKKIDFLIAVIERNHKADAMFKADSLSPNRYLSRDEVVGLIKSLRPQPHWKPSKEQMEALARATNRCVGVDDAKILIKLLERLEKL